MTSTSKSRIAANVNGKIMDIPWNDSTMITNTKVHRIPPNDKKDMALNRNIANKQKTDRPPWNDSTAINNGLGRKLGRITNNEKKIDTSPNKNTTNEKTADHRPPWNASTAVSKKIYDWPMKPKRQSQNYHQFRPGKSSISFYDANSVKDLTTADDRENTNEDFHLRLGKSPISFDEVMHAKDVTAAVDRKNTNEDLQLRPGKSSISFDDANSVKDVTTAYDRKKTNKDFGVRFRVNIL